MGYEYLRECEDFQSERCLTLFPGVGSIVPTKTMALPWGGIYIVSTNTKPFLGLGSIVPSPDHVVTMAWEIYFPQTTNSLPWAGCSISPSRQNFKKTFRLIVILLRVGFHFARGLK